MKPLFQPTTEIVLASRSPRRRELLSQLVSEDRIRVIPPRDPDEPGFDDHHSREEIAARLLSIAEDKAHDVAGQLDAVEACCVIAADTAIVVGSDETGWSALGQPPESDWEATTRRWFRAHYADQTHLAMTGFHVAHGTAARSRVVTTQVTFREDVDELLETYLASGEPRGKAGGYGIQGLGSLFVERIEGSLTNVIGLPLRELADVLGELDVVS